MRSLSLVLLMLLALVSAGCEMIGDIFQAGVWVGGIVVVLVIALVAFLATKLRG